MPNEAPVMSVQYLLRLADLGWEYVESEAGHYPHTRIELVPDELVVIHGVKTGKHPGMAAVKNLEDRGYSVICGHTHKQAIVRKTVHPAPGISKVITSVEAGHLSKNDGHGYVPEFDVNWTQGFCTVSIFDDKRFDVELASYECGTLTWRGQAWS
jgi:hypothetical protein